MVVLIIGYPNAGKTTYAARFGRVIHIDDFRDSLQPGTQYKRCHAFIASVSDDIVVEGCYPTRKLRTDFLNACQRKNDFKMCIWIDTPIAECKQRENRGRPIMYSHFEPPTIDEGWNTIIRVDGTHDFTKER